jgi:hypothetical protein
MRLVIPVILGLLSSAAAAQDGAEEAAGRVAAEAETGPERCVRTRSIRRTRVIDDQTIAFFMRNGDVYINSLPSRCPQLDREQRFSYTVRSGQLCSTDVITVLLQFAGRLEPGFTCRLSEFVPSDAETVEIMIAAEESDGAVPPVRAEPAELPPDDEDAAAAEPEQDTGADE